MGYIAFVVLDFPGFILDRDDAFGAYILMFYCVPLQHASVVCSIPLLGFLLLLSIPMDHNVPLLGFPLLLSTPME